MTDEIMEWPGGPLTPRMHMLAEPTRLVLRVQHEALSAARSFLSANGFTELLLPVIGPVTDPGTRGSKQADVDFYGHRYKLMTSAILYKQVSLLACDRIFCVAPNVRLEPAETSCTSRHLAEFRQIDVEIARASRDHAMEVAEGLLKHVIERITESMPDELEKLECDPQAIVGGAREQFERITHSGAAGMLDYFGYGESGSAEIRWDAEEMLSEKASSPFFVIDYPKGSRGFYDREDDTRPGILKSFDLIAPGGYGELASGAEREFDYVKIVTRMRETGENPAKYRWYLDVVRAGIPPSAGFGMGVERLTRYLTGRSAVWEATAFPKLPGRAMA